MNANQVEIHHDEDLFASVTEEEIIKLWNSIRTRGLDADAAWAAIVASIGLSMGFGQPNHGNA